MRLRFCTECAKVIAAEVATVTTLEVDLVGGPLPPHDSQLGFRLTAFTYFDYPANLPTSDFLQRKQAYSAGDLLTCAIDAQQWHGQ